MNITTEHLYLYFCLNLVTIFDDSKIEIPGFSGGGGGGEGLRFLGLGVDLLLLLRVDLLTARPGTFPLLPPFFSLIEMFLRTP